MAVNQNGYTADGKRLVYSTPEGVSVPEMTTRQARQVVQVARAPEGQWIYLFRPEVIPNRGIEDKSFVQPGVLRAERLVNMSRHQYCLEPNPSFTPDQKWVVFRSNMFGPVYVFAVEVAKAAAGKTTE